MKKAVIILPAIVFSLLSISCNNHDDYEEIKNVFATKIDSVQIGQGKMVLGSTQEIKMYSTFTKGCEGLYSQDYRQTNDSVRTLANIAYKSNAACGSGTYVDGSRVNFAPTRKGTFTFKFFTGKGSAGEDTFLEKKIIVE